MCCIDTCCNVIAIDLPTITMYLQYIICPLLLKNCNSTCQTVIIITCITIERALCRYPQTASTCRRLHSLRSVQRDLPVQVTGSPTQGSPPSCPGNHWRTNGRCPNSRRTRTTTLRRWLFCSWWMMNKVWFKHRLYPCFDKAWKK